MPASSRISDPWLGGPQWLRQRSLGKRQGKRMQTSIDLMERLQQESCLEGHNGCVNCLEWNQQGDLLASGSDDCNVIIWNAFRKTKRSLVKTGHDSCIFSVKFMPGTDDNQVATCAGDGQVRLNGTLNSETLFACRECHSERVKRLAVHPGEPNLIWSAGEDGYVLQYDTREKHVCKFSKPKNLLIDLNTIHSCMAAKCIAINPVRSEMLAVGSNDIYNRLFDRRYIHKDGPKSCTAYFAAGHLHRTNNRSNNLQSYGTTYLAFSSDGSELLASVHAEQVYLFNTYEPWERYRSFDVSIKPLLMDKAEQQTGSCNSLKLRPFSYLNQLRELKPIELPRDLATLCDDLWSGQSWKSSQVTINHLNEALAKISNSPDLYRARAIALTSRNWRGDYYQALRDCCCALALRPLDWKTIRCLTTILVKLADTKAVHGLLEFVENALVEFGPIEELIRSREFLLTFKRSPSPTHSQRSSFDDSDSNISDLSATSSGGRLSTSDELYGSSIYNEFAEISMAMKREAIICSRSFDFSRRFCGHCNMNTDIKEANFFGSNDEFIVSGSDDGAFYIWDKYTSNIVKAVHADYQILNCVQPHPNICMLATSGIGTSVKLWSANGKICRDVETLETRCAQNQKYISTDPLEAMYMMLYPEPSDVRL